MDLVLAAFKADNLKRKSVDSLNLANCVAKTTAGNDGRFHLDLAKSLKPGTIVNDGDYVLGFFDNKTGSCVKKNFTPVSGFTVPNDKGNDDQVDDSSDATSTTDNFKPTSLAKRLDLKSDAAKKSK